jgi:hypothetical protein
MSMERRNAWVVALYLIAGAIVVVLIVAEMSVSRFDACMSVGAFSKSQCEDYARE